MRKSDKRIARWIVTLLFVIVGLNFLRDIRYHRNQWEWVTVKKSALNRTIPATGVVEAIKVENISLDVREKVNKIFVKEGDLVQAGEPLVELSQAQTRLEYEQKRNHFRESKSNFKKAKKEVKTQNELLKNFAVSQSQVDEAIRGLAKARSSLDIAEREFNIVKEKLAGTTILSPLHGHILKLHLKEGEYIRSDKPIITVGDTSEYIVRSQVDELNIRWIKVGLDSEIIIEAFQETPIEGYVATISPQASRESFANVDVNIKITDAKSLPLRHNLSCRANIFIEQIPNAIGIPFQSVIKKDEKKARIMVQSKWGLIRSRIVTLDGTAGEFVVLQSGLNDGELVGIPKILQ